MDQDVSNRIHHSVGQKVRETMKEISGTLPENLPVYEDINKKIAKSKKNQSLKPPDEN